MQKLTPTDIPQAAEVFARAMYNDPLHTAFFPHEKNRMKRLTALYTYRLQSQLAVCYKSSPQMEALVIWENAHEHHAAITANDVRYGIPFSLKVGIPNLRRMTKYLLWATKVKNALISEPYGYLHALATAPEHQGKGHASALLRPLLESARDRGEKVYLETHNARNLKIYGKLGFQNAAVKHYQPLGLTQYCLIKTD